MHRTLPLMTVCIATILSGCLGGEEVPSTVLAAPSAMAWEWTPDAFRWSDAVDGNAVARIVTTGIEYSCRVAFDRQPSATVAGWDLMVTVRGSGVGSWVFMGSAWTAAHAHAGPFDTADHLEPFTDDGRYPVDWDLEDLEGEVEIVAVALHLEKDGDVPNVALDVACTDGIVERVALGRDAVLFGEASGGDGAGASAGVVFFDPTASVVSGDVLKTGAEEVWLSVSGYTDSTAMVTVEGNGTEHSLSYMPRPDAPVAAEGGSFLDVVHVGGAGTYSYAVTEVSRSGIHGALFGVEPLEMSDG